MSKFKRFFCRHDKIGIMRAHPESSFGQSNPGKVAWVDVHKVNNYLVCAKCGAILKYERYSEIFGEKE